MFSRRRLIGTLSALGAFFSLALASLSHASEILTLTHQGIERTAVMHRPAATVGRPVPMVLALHGLGGTGESFRSYARLDAAAERAGFVVVYPDAVAEAWSYGRPINQPMPTVGSDTVDDVGFIRLLIDDLVSRRIADPARIYVTGISRGGLMAYTLACALADRIAGAAPLITGMSEYQREDCRPTRPVPIMVVAGTSDREQAFDGGQGRQGRLLSVPETMNFWRSLHGCTQRDSRVLPHRDPADPTRVVVVEWSGCRSEASPRLYRVERGGHQLPSFRPSGSPMSEERFGPRNRDFETADEVWAFFESFSLAPRRGTSAQ
jgi:polyhydroxybutyrate depolymerase